jgi:hypothetical protein
MSERITSRNPWLVSFTLFASYAFGTNVAIALHEFGHAMGCWLAGGKILGLYLAPQGYSASYARPDLADGYATTHGHPVLLAGGPVFGAAYGVIFLLATRVFKRGTFGWITTYAVATWCVGNNGAYLLLGSLRPFGDALYLAEEGVPRWSLFLFGLPLVVAYPVLFSSFLRGIGLRREDPYLRWVLIVETGLLLYLATVATSRLVWPTDGHLAVSAGDRVARTVSPVLILILASVTFMCRRVGRWPEAPTAEPRWTKAVAVFVLGLLFIVAEVRFFGLDFESPQRIRTFGKIRAELA